MSVQSTVGILGQCHHVDCRRKQNQDDPPSLANIHDEREHLNHLNGHYPGPGHEKGHKYDNYSLDESEMQKVRPSFRTQIKAHQ